MQEESRSFNIPVLKTQDFSDDACQDISQTLETSELLKGIPIVIVGPNDSLAEGPQTQNEAELGLPSEEKLWQGQFIKQDHIKLMRKVQPEDGSHHHEHLSPPEPTEPGRHRAQGHLRAPCGASSGSKDELTQAFSIEAEEDPSKYLTQQERQQQHLGEQQQSLRLLMAGLAA